MSDGLSLLSLFASSFLSATLLPGNSEVVLVALLVSGVSHPRVLVLTATMGNSLGGLTNVILGRFFPLRKNIALARKSHRLVAALWRCHTIIKLDAGCGGFAVPVSRVDAHLVGPSSLFLCLGKALRYVVVAAVTTQGIMWWH